MSAGRKRFKPPLPYESVPKQPFRRLPPETWSLELHRADALVAALVDLRCLEILAAPSIGAREVGRTAADLAQAAGVRAERRPAFVWLLRRLADAGLLAGDPGGRPTTPRPASASSATRRDNPPLI